MVGILGKMEPIFVLVEFQMNGNPKTDTLRAWEWKSDSERWRKDYTGAERLHYDQVKPVDSFGRHQEQELKYLRQKFYHSHKHKKHSNDAKSENDLKFQIVC
jgi:hypothetical protein